MEFSVPVTGDDLLTPSRSSYVVHNLLDQEELPDQLSAASAAFREDGPLAVLRHFDTLFSVIRHFSELERTMKDDTWETLVEGTASLYIVLNDLLDSQLSLSTRQQHCNATKMLCYLITQFMTCAQREQSKSHQIVTGKSAGRGRKSQRSATDSSKSGWEGICVRGLYSIIHLLELEIHRLWEPPVPEESFVNCVTSCCYKLMESQSAVKNKEIRQLIFRMLGIAIQKYKHGIGAVVKVIQLVQNFEHLVTPLAEAMQFFATSCGVKNIVSETIREIGSLDASDLSRDTSGTRCLALFVCELGERVPLLIFPTISSLVPHLDGENYSFRNSVLVVLGEMVCQVLGREDMDDNGKATREQFLDRLQQHVHDINAFVRSKVLQIWLKLFKEQVIPLSRQQQLIPLVVGRLHDKSSMVRRYAIQFLSAALCGNPYAAKLSLSDLRADLQKAESKLKELEDSRLPSSSQENHSQLSNSRDRDEPDTDEMETNNSAAVSDSPSPEPVADKVQKQGMATTSEKEIQQHQVLVTYLKDCVKFVQHLESATPVVCQLLGSKTVSDVLEAINFFVMCHEFGISTSKEGVRKMLVLVWSRETAVKEALTTAYKRLSRAITVADSLISLTYGLTLGELASLEELMCQFMRNKDIPHDVIQCLWESFSSEFKDDEGTRKSRAAVLLLGMLAGENNEVVKCNLDVLVLSGLKQKDQAKLDLKKAKLTCIALQKIAKTEKVKPGSLPPPLFRLPCNHSVVESLQNLILSTLCDFNCVEWIPFAEQAIKTIYKLSEHPDVVCDNLIQSMAHTLSCQLTTNSQEISALIDELREAEPLAQSSQDPSASSTDILPTPPDAVSSNVTCPSAFLARFLTVAGQVAISQLVHLDVAVYKELKRRQEVEGRKKELEREKEKETEKQSRKSKRRSSASSKQADDGTSLAEEIGLEGAAAEDTEAETIRRICETEIVTGRNLLSAVRPLVVMVCAQPSKYPDRQLRMAATLALSRFMAVSSEFCDAHLQLLFTILEKSPEAVVRSNTIIAIGDLTVRFPNLVEPWTPHLYARLTDECVDVRKNTLIVLTRLILNDMLKVKGQISEIAVCVEDGDCHIRNLARLFFHELSHKGNAIYNILPDIISQLSDPDRALARQHFTAIMKYLMSFIQKDKQSESLIEKLCHRIRAAKTERQSSDLAFCLAQLSFSEKGLRKLQENFACYHDRLANDETHSHFMAIITKIRKFAKPEVKAVLDDLEKAIEECHCQGVDEDDTAQRAAQASKKARSKRRGTGKTPDRQISPEPGESGNEFDLSKRRELRPRSEPQKTQPKARTRRVIEDDSESESRLLDSDSLFEEKSGSEVSGVDNDCRENISPSVRRLQGKSKGRRGRASGKRTRSVRDT